MPRKRSQNAAIRAQIPEQFQNVAKPDSSAERAFG